MESLLDQGAASWRKSSYSHGSGSDCVETGMFPEGALAVRDTKASKQGPVLAFPRDQWVAFVRNVGADV